MLSGHKRIISLLLTYCCFRAMTRQQSGLIWQRVYLLSYALLELFPASTGKIGAADGTRKDEVAAETNSSGGHVKDAMTNCMSRREADFELYISQLQFLSMHKIDRWLGARINIKTEHSSPTSGPPQHMVVRVQRHQR